MFRRFTIMTTLLLAVFTNVVLVAAVPLHADSSSFQYTPTNLAIPAVSVSTLLAPVTTPTVPGNPGNNNPKPQDIVSVQPSTSTVTVQPSNGNGTFGAPISTVISGGAQAIAVADFNNDGMLDLVVTQQLAGHQDGDIVVLTGDGHGHFSNPVMYAAGRHAGFYSTYSTVQAADLNHDGHPDIVLGESGTECCNRVGIEVLLNNGTGAFSAPVQYSLGSTYVGVLQLTLSDMNNDGNLDAVTTNSDSFGGYAIVVQKGLGDGTFAPPVVTNAPWPRSFVLADINHDGIMDVVTSTDYYNDSIPRQLAVYMGKGDGSFQVPVLYDVPLNGGEFRLAIVDGNNDGFPDVAVASPTDTRIMFFQNDGVGNLTPVIPAASVRAHTAVTELLSGYINSDTTTDLLSVNAGGDPGDGTNVAPDMTIFLNSQPQLKDTDQDGIPDALEQQLAEKYAPTLLFDPSEPNYPIGVDSFLSLPSHPSLMYFEQCFRNAIVSNLTSQAGPLTQANLLGHAVIAQSCGRSTAWSPITSEQSDPMTNYGAPQNSGKVNEAFYLSDVTRRETAGSLDPAHWVTYYHAYPAYDGGVMIQYWHFFTSNDWQNGGGPNFDGHFGDWDASIQIHLGPDLSSIEHISYSRHEHDAPGDTMTNIVYLQGSSPPFTTKEKTAYIINGTHPLVMVDSGGHGAFASPADTCSYWKSVDAGHTAGAFGKQTWGDPAQPASLAEVSCNPRKSSSPAFQYNVGGTVWDTQSAGKVVQAGSKITVKLTTANPGGPLRNLGEYNPGNMATCSTCAGLAPGTASFHPDTAGVFTGYSGLWGSPNVQNRWGFGYPPRGPVFQGYNNHGAYLSWYNEASNTAWH